MSGHADTIRTALTFTDAHSERYALNALDALLAENQRLADRAVCSGCGSDVDEGGACHYTNCEGGEMIPASDLPGALLALNDARQEEREEWRFDWEALRAEAKELEAENQRLKLAKANAEIALMQQLETNTRRTGELVDVLAENQRLREDMGIIAGPRTLSIEKAKRIAREALAGEDG